MSLSSVASPGVMMGQGKTAIPNPATSSVTRGREPGYNLLRMDGWQGGEPFGSFIGGDCQQHNRCITGLGSMTLLVVYIWPPRPAGGRPECRRTCMSMCIFP